MTSIKTSSPSASGKPSPSRPTARPVLDLETPARRPRGRPRAEDLAELEARLITVGRQVFYQQGYGAAIMDAVASAARVSKGTLYSRFASKEELFRAVVKDQMDSWEDGVNARRLPMGRTLEATLRAYGELWARAGMSPDFLSMSRLLFSESARFPELAESAREKFDRGVAAVQAVIVFFAEKDGVACKNPRAAAELFQHMISGWMYAAIVSDRPIEPAVAKAWMRRATQVFVAARPVW